MIADALEQTADGPVTQRLRGIIATNENILETSGDALHLAQHGDCLGWQWRQMVIATLHTLAALADRPESGIEVQFLPA